MPKLTGHTILGTILLHGVRVHVNQSILKEERYGFAGT